MAFPTVKRKEIFDPYGYAENFKIAKKLNYKNKDDILQKFKEWNKKNTGNDQYSKQMHELNRGSSLN